MYSSNRPSAGSSTQTATSSFDRALTAPPNQMNDRQRDQSTVLPSLTRLVAWLQDGNCARCALAGHDHRHRMSHCSNMPPARSGSDWFDLRRAVQNKGWTSKEERQEQPGLSNAGKPGNACCNQCALPYDVGKHKRSAQGRVIVASCDVSANEMWYLLAAMHDRDTRLAFEATLVYNRGEGEGLRYHGDLAVAVVRYTG